MWGLWGVVQERLNNGSHNIQFNYLVSLACGHH